MKEKEERGKGNAQTAASQRKGSGNAVDPRWGGNFYDRKSRSLGDRRDLAGRSSDRIFDRCPYADVAGCSISSRGIVSWLLR